MMTYVFRYHRLCLVRRGRRRSLWLWLCFINHQFLKTTFEYLELSARLQKEAKDQGLRADVYDRAEDHGYNL